MISRQCATVCAQHGLRVLYTCVLVCRRSTCGTRKSGGLNARSIRKVPGSMWDEHVIMDVHGCMCCHAMIAHCVRGCEYASKLLPYLQWCRVVFACVCCTRCHAIISHIERVCVCHYVISLCNGRERRGKRATVNPPMVSRVVHVCVCRIRPLLQGSDPAVRCCIARQRLPWYPPCSI